MKKDKEIIKAVRKKRWVTIYYSDGSQFKFKLL